MEILKSINLYNIIKIIIAIIFFILTPIMAMYKIISKLIKKVKGLMFKSLIAFNLTK